MEQKQITLEQIYHRVQVIEAALRARGITIAVVDNAIKEDDEGELTEEFKARLEKRRSTPEIEYISFEDVKKRVLKKK